MASSVRDVRETRLERVTLTSWGNVLCRTIVESQSLSSTSMVTRFAKWASPALGRSAMICFGDSFTEAIDSFASNSAKNESMLVLPMPVDPATSRTFAGAPLPPPPVPGGGDGEPGGDALAAAEERMDARYSAIVRLTSSRPATVRVGPAGFGVRALAEEGLVLTSCRKRKVLRRRRHALRGTEPTEPDDADDRRDRHDVTVVSAGGTNCRPPSPSAHAMPLSDASAASMMPIITSSSLPFTAMESRRAIGTFVSFMTISSTTTRLPSHFRMP
eukprot:gene2089-biopygen2053